MQNLLVDPGFEVGNPIWQHLSDGGRSIVSFPVHSGAGALEIQVSTQFTRAVFQNVSILSGTAYTVRGWIKTSGIDGGGALFEVDWLDDSGAAVRVDSIDTVTGTQDWTFVSASPTAPTNAVTARLRMVAQVDPDGVGMVWFDDLEMLGAPGSADPTVAFSTYLGGSSEETFRDTAFDAQGNFYVVGGNASTDYPTTPGAYDTTLNTSGSLVHDALVTKLSSNGVVIWSTMVGGPEYDRAYAVEVDSQGYVYIAGRAGAGFPTTPGVVQPNFAGDDNPNALYGEQDGFVAKLTPDGSSLVWATYFGPDDRSFIRDLDIDASGNVYVILTALTNPFSLVTPGAYQTSQGGNTDSVVAKISPDGTQVLWATYLGGSQHDLGTPSIRVNDNGEVFVAGATNSPDIPTTSGAYDRTWNGNYDMYLGKLSADGSQLLIGTYLGGSETEFTETHGLALDSMGNAVVAATTLSNDFVFPPGTFQPSYGGSGGSSTGSFTNYPGDGFIIIVSGNTGSFIAGTYLGGRFGEGLEGVMLDALDNVYVTGATYSDDFPTTPGAFQSDYAGNADFYAAKFSPDLTTMLYGTYIGGFGQDFCRSCSVDSAGNFYICGQTQSDNWPLVSAIQTSRNGGEEGALVLLRTANGECPLGDGSACDDNDNCTTDDTCQSGVCSGTPVDCGSLDNACRIGVCDAGTGQCTGQAINDGQSCDTDGNLCTVGGSCQSGSCVGEQVMNCSDGIPCTVDSCVAGACVHVGNDAFCSDDGLFCDGSEVCVPGTGCTSAGNPCVVPANCDEVGDSCGCEPPTAFAEGPRYIAVTPPMSGTDVALRITGLDPETACVAAYVQADGTLGPTPVYRPAHGPDGWETVHVHDGQIVAGMNYKVEADCDASQPNSVVSAYTPVLLWEWGDVDNSATIDVIDITRVVDGFRGSLLDVTPCTSDADCTLVAPSFHCDNAMGRCLRITIENVDLLGAGACPSDGVIDILDITNDVDAFRGFPDPCANPCN